jgi:hypothetical protein
MYAQEDEVTTQDKDVADVIADIRTRVRDRRASAAGGVASADDLAFSEMQATVQDVNVNARVNSHLPLLWEDMVVGRLRSLVQRVVRRLLRWYINPIVDQQNVYNAASAKALTLLAAENARLRRDIADMSTRVAALEKGHKL